MNTTTSKISLLDHQYKFLTSSSKFLLLLGGVGSGKTYAGSAYIHNRSGAFPNAMGGIFAMTYKQLYNVTLRSVFNFLNQMNESYKYNQQKGILNINGSELFCGSLDNYDPIRGIEIGYAWMDEGAYAKREAFDMLMGRLRDKRGPLEIRITTTPKGFNYLYDYFHDSDSSDFNVINATSHDNLFLPETYIKSLKESYDEKVYQQEVEGKFINITSGRIYYAFDRSIHVKPIIKSTKHPIYFGNDFNVNPMTSIVCQYVDNVLYCLDEIWLMSSDTYEMGDTMGERFGRGWKVVPDSTGKALRSSAGGVSDHDILRDKGFQIVGHGNPFRVDRYNTVNNLLEKGRIVIDPKCVKLIRDLEQVSYKEGSTLPDTAQKDLTHISDCLGYVSYYLSPILSHSSDVRMIPR